MCVRYLCTCVSQMTEDGADNGTGYKKDVLYRCEFASVFEGKDTTGLSVMEQNLDRLSAKIGSVI